MTDRHRALNKVVYCALSLKASELYADEHPEIPHGDAECEYKEDGLIEACRELVKAVDRD